MLERADEQISVRKDISSLLGLLFPYSSCNKGNITAHLLRGQKMQAGEMKHSEGLPQTVSPSLEVPQSLEVPSGAALCWVDAVVCV